MVFNWTDADEKLLLMRILAQSGMKAPDFNEVVAGMPEGVTVEACKHRMRKIKKEIEAMEVGTSSASGSGTVGGSTPAKSGGGKKANSTPATGKRKAGKKAAAESDESPSCDQDDKEESPTKKLKSTAVKQEITQEDDDDDDDRL
ncbi:hypothetical protein CKM354_000886000 [Cercospora kikuchii]|uniref:Myb-like domain-containing protein n=1 Tax=Cercospora kikuchii TaxID=84275 RepID=A0A9P3CWM0_9PEZI|nr:uncharacterized protein CKM354_000886000 [Cercospora kikuchii]GIZ45703.1 hypothetical protein CKM354_000886000 [Cercospora kikuchii]